MTASVHVPIDHAALRTLCSPSCTLEAANNVTIASHNKLMLLRSDPPKFKDTIMRHSCDLAVRTIKRADSVRYSVAVQFTDFSNELPGVHRQSSFFNSQYAFKSRMEQAGIPREKMAELEQALNSALAVRNEVITVKGVFMDSDQMQQLGFNTLAASSRGIVQNADEALHS